LLQFRPSRHFKLETPVRAEIGLRRFRVVLNRILFADEQRVAIRLKDDESRRVAQDGRVARGLEDLDDDRITAGRHRLMKIHAAIDRAHQHGLLSERWMIKRKLPLRIGLGACNRLHASLKLDEENLHACGG